MIQVVAPHPNARAEKLTGRDYLSYSAIGTYQQCPLKYYFKYRAGLPEATVASSLIFGGAVHRGFEHHFNELLAGNEPPSLDALMAEYDRAWQEVDVATVQFGKEDDRESLNRLGQRMFAAFQASELAHPVGNILGVEEQLRGQIAPNCPDLLGRVDLLIETDNELQVIDLKTSRTRWSREQAEDQGSQLLLYSELVRPLAPRKRMRLQFAVLTKTKEPVLELHDVQPNPQRIARTKRIIERVWQAIETEVYYPAPSAMNCPSCPFREPCRAWQG